jgi:predicted GIY-YIG superfamily endonuclease
MHIVYLLRSKINPNRVYVGLCGNMKNRLTEHNLGDSVHTNHYRPWRLVNYFAFLSRAKAEKFEHYLKTGASSG